MSWLTKFHRQTPGGGKLRAPQPEQAQQDFRAVQIKPGKEACARVKEISERIFLCREAPFVPLEYCACREKCKCRYLHYDDRRQNLRRNADNGLPAGYVEKERRARADRRKTLAYQL